MEAISYDTDAYMDPAVPGMLADLGFADKITVPCGAAQAFGTVVGIDATGASILPVANAQGIAIRDSSLSGRIGGQVGYVQYDPMSVIKRNRIWALASGVCTKNAAAKYDPATGIFADAGTATLAHAKFLTGDVSITALVAGNATRRIVQVELHDPSVA